MDFREGGRWLYAMMSPENVAARWSLAEGAGTTTVQIVKKMASLSQLEQFTAMGYYKDGLSAGFANLDEYLLTPVTNK